MNSLKDHPLMDERPDMLEPEDWGRSLRTDFGF